MIYAYDQWAQMPVKDLYDTLIMAMAINAAKDMYDKGEQAIKDFRKEYGDFYSPIKGDMDKYYNVIGGVNDTIKDLYARGIDPIRSVEGRAAVQSAINSVDPKSINWWKERADNAKKWYENAAKLKAANMYDENYSLFLLERPDDWADDYAGTSSPTVYQDLQSMVHPSFKEIQPHLLTEEEARSRIGDAYDPRYDYKGVTREDMENVMNRWMPGVRNNSNFKYHRYLAEQDVIRQSGDPNYKPSEDEIDAQFVKNAIQADAQIMTPLDRDADKFAYLKASTDAAISEAYAKEAASFKYDKLRANDPDISSKNNRSSGSGNKDKLVPSIFEDADNKLAAALLSGPTSNGMYGEYGKLGETAFFNTQTDPYYQWVAPAQEKVGEIERDGKYAYRIPREDGNIYYSGQYDQSGNKLSARNATTRGDYIFVPNGHLRAELDKNGYKRYYLLGYLQNEGGKGYVPSAGGGSEVFEMEVKENDYNYGKKQENEYEPTNRR